MAIQPVVKKWNPMKVLNLPAGTVAIREGDLLSWESGALVPVDTVTEDLTFIGIAGGKRVNTGDPIPVYTECVVEIDLTSAAYVVGQGLMYTSDNTLVDAATANSIAFFFEDNKTTARGDVYIDVTIYSKLFEQVA